MSFQLVMDLSSSLDSGLGHGDVDAKKVACHALHHIEVTVFKCRYLRPEDPC